MTRDAKPTISAVMPPAAIDTEPEPPAGVPKHSYVIVPVGVVVQVDTVAVSVVET